MLSDVLCFIYLDGHDVCFLCEAPVDVKFEPCGHALMCHNCADRAKKCPTCKVLYNVYLADRISW